MSHTLLVENFVDSDEDARLLHVAKPIVDGGAEELHRGREPHVGVYQRRDVITQLAHLAVKDAIIVLEAVLTEQFVQLLLRRLYLKRLERNVS